MCPVLSQLTTDQGLEVICHRGFKIPTSKLRPVYYFILFIQLGNVYKGMFANYKSQLKKRKTQSVLTRKVAG